MDRFRIRGGTPLRGSVQIGGAKNAALPILFSSLLTEGRLKLKNVPNLQDIVFTIKVLEHLGVAVDSSPSSHEVALQAKDLKSYEAPYDLVRKMRASVLVLGPLLARFGEARVSLPGGCAIGARPIDIHLSGMEAMGATIELHEGYVLAKAKRLEGCRYRLPFPSVGGTENLMMAATLARGETVFENCAQEPEIANLAEVLVSMGAEIEGAGTSTIRIQGKDQLSGGEGTIIGDRIEAGTFLLAALATQGQVKVNGIKPNQLEAVLKQMEVCGARVKREDNAIAIESTGKLKAISFKTEPFPGFPTDMQAQFMALLCLVPGESQISETIFENRFMHVPELARMGAAIRIAGNEAIITGPSVLKGAPVMATDLRASASLVIAALAAEGETNIHRIYHLDRGYEVMEVKLKQLGGDVERLRD